MVEDVEDEEIVQTITLPTDACTKRSGAGCVHIIRMHSSMTNQSLRQMKARPIEWNPLRSKKVRVPFKLIAQSQPHSMKFACLMKKYETEVSWLTQ